MSRVALLSVVGVGGVAGTALGAYHFKIFSSSVPTIADRLQKEKYKLLKDDDPHWTKSLEEYKKKHSGKDSYTVQELKNLCKVFLKKKEVEDNSYSEAKRYCVSLKKVSERLGDLGFTLLDINTTNSDNNPNKDQWTSLAKKYKTEGVSAKELDGLTASTVGDNGAQWSKLQEKCKTVFEKTHWDEKYESLVKNAEAWCTLQGFNGISK
ncbi:hypothetical protein MHC_03665 [Mycoplasma haemocanis str. Illinois]|uniref:Uncharacterized protein n=1 Tax=Mycoplasma haemocanis (strain Illinois) TaxID=1111676 RepID=H6N7H1_MYCHN|nr:hypothetical protein [Mycoplasma haemocanis]AEW45593.1 hypothetical protein MHC_03665 [Mycoplasma haemocanis str. Illinois]